MKIYDFLIAYQEFKKIIVLLFLVFLVFYAKSQKVYFFTINPEIKLVTDFYADSVKRKTNKIHAITRQINFFYKNTPNEKGLIGSGSCLTSINNLYYSSYTPFFEKEFGKFEKFKTRDKKTTRSLQETSIREKKLSNKISYELSINDTFKCICNFFPNSVEAESKQIVFNNYSPATFTVLFGTASTIALNTNVSNMLFADTSYYYYSNAKKMIEHFNIDTQNYVLDSLERFTMLNFNSIHYEWKYAVNNLPEIVLKIPIILFDSTIETYLNPEVIYFKYKGTMVTSVKHFHALPMYKRMIDIFTRGYKNVTYLQELLSKKNVLKSTTFFETVMEKDCIGSQISGYLGGFLAHFTYNANSTIKTMQFKSGLNFFSGNYYYDKTHLVKKIVYKNMYSDNLHRTSILENSFLYTIIDK